MSDERGYRASDAQAYKIFLGRWTKALAAALVAWARFPEDGRLLDLGCGTGSLAGAMRGGEPGRAVFGVDRALPYIRHCVRRHGPLFAAADAMGLPFADSTFAGTAAQLVLNFVPDPLVAVREMRRVTRPGGGVAAAVWDFRGGLVYQRLFWDTAAAIDPAAGKVRDRLFSDALALPGGLAALFARAGLADIESHAPTIRMDYASFADYWEPLLGGQGPVGAYAAGLDGEMRARVEGAVRAAYLSGAADGPRSLTATAWVARARVP